MNILNPWCAIFFVGWLAYMRIRGVYAHRTRRIETAHRQIDGLENFLLVFVIGGSTLLPALYLFTPLLSFADYKLPSWAPWLGLAIMLPTLWLFWRSHADLGQNWSVSLEVRKSHALVTHGVYRRIRHPMYAAIFLFSIAQALMLPNWLAGFSALVPFAVMYVLRTPREERMMLAHFGQEYADYMAQTGRLVPKIGAARHSSVAGEAADE